MPATRPYRFVATASLVLAAFCIALGATAAEPAPPDARYLQLEANWVGEPYQWQLEDGTVLHRGLSDDRARAAVFARPGQERYALETLQMRYPLRIAAECWTQPQARFAGCVELGQAGPSRARQQADAEAERAQLSGMQRRRARAAWTGLAPEAAERILHRTLAGQAAWDATPQARQGPAGFDCGAGAHLPPLQGEGQRRFQAALDAGPRTPAGETELVAAARLGHWRAAAALAKLALYDDDWESTQAIAAWLLERDIPAGYNALARSLGAASSYEHGQASPGERDAAARLRWRAAAAGDPGAQMDLADELAASDSAASERLRACAVRRFPDIGG